MNEQFFQERYPENYPGTIDADKYNSVIELFDRFVKKFADRPAFMCLGHTLSYQDLDVLSAQFASYLQHELGLQPGERIAIQLPNILQYPIVVFGAMRAGLVVVNTNPLYTEREMEHQFNDSGAKALVVLANMADKAEKILSDTGIQHVIVTEVADLHPGLKRMLINGMVKYVKKQVPDYHLPGAVTLRAALAKGAKRPCQPYPSAGNDVAVLQYTGGTTGVAKGAMLTHRNLIANMLQCHGLFVMALDEGVERVVAPLPLYHIYAFTVHCMVLLETGNCSLLIPNPRDIPGFVKTLQQHRFSAFVGLNTLFVAMCNQEKFRQLDFSGLKLTISGGMALTTTAAEQWKKVTGNDIAEGYGMTETSPVVSFNPPGHIQLGSIGMPVSSTLCITVDDDGHELPLGERGELCVKGPQVMKGYWKREAATDEAFLPGADGLPVREWLRTGDIAVIQDDGYMRIVDRKKDMIIVSGFNVYPNEVEDVIADHPEVMEVAAIGVPDLKSSEAVKVFVVVKSELSEADLRHWCKERLTNYKVPKYVEFRTELPKTNVGKILRRELRAEELAQSR
ncbi:AMP-binding protein [Oceanobacter sp. 3_MG-2023]|uniref:AMP-binding protein n=1 Tax=Oceanobacter sp. 3_MG-2023 TaxID=3062622 RepID=UPI002733FD14|nr:AMP-binding protein [Oceanobacter sp. 3_MG-2023]MDP2504427.1 AMP-binding protein [Oceanobacter sp. 3_MG-2023]